MKLPFVLLAAGKGTRMGASKALLDFGGRPWLRVQVDAIRAQTQGPVRVVLAPEAVPEAKLLAGLEGVETVLNPTPERGPFSSLQSGLDGLGGPVFVGPLDCPVTPILSLLLGGLTEDVEAVLPTHQGRGGHPVLLGAALVERLRSMDPLEASARLDLQLRAVRQHRIEVEDDRVLLNLNDPASWAGHAKGASFGPL